MIDDNFYNSGRRPVDWGVRRPAPLCAQLWRNSMHKATRLWKRCVLQRAASLAFDEGENVQNRGNAANVFGNTHESSLHPGILKRQVFNMFAHTLQPVAFQQKVR